MIVYKWLDMVPLEEHACRLSINGYKLAPENSVDLWLCYCMRCIYGCEWCVCNGCEWCACMPANL